jgi:hypothetical protein
MHRTYFAPGGVRESHDHSAEHICHTRTRSAQDKYNPIRQVHIFDETQHVYLQNKLGSHCHI